MAKPKFRKNDIVIDIRNNLTYWVLERVIREGHSHWYVVSENDRESIPQLIEERHLIGEESIDTFAEPNPANSKIVGA